MPWRESVTGPVNLSADGSILVGTTDGSAGIVAPTIVLSALKGSVGTAADPLEIDVSTGSLTVSAAHDIVLVDVAGVSRVADIACRARATSTLRQRMPQVPGRTSTLMTARGEGRDWGPSS